MSAPLNLRRDAYGRLVLTDLEGVAHVGVVPVRSFPVSAPLESLSLVNTEGHEVAWLPEFGRLDPSVKALIEAELQVREFMPRIQRIVAVSSFATPSTWQLETDRGPVDLVLKGEEDIRRLGGQALLIADRHGVNFLLPDLSALDRQSRKLLDRFL
jgi:Domain of unknown function (DUF1854)